MIVVTGGAGFIGSALIWYLNEQGHRDIIAIDRLGLDNKWQNLAKRDFHLIIPTPESLDWLQDHIQEVDVIFHMGACSSTTERDGDFLMRNNVLYTQKLWQLCSEHAIPLIYASSAATYGAEESDFSDQHEGIPSLRPINKYGFSKQIFDRWALQQVKTPSHWFGLKFFNVYGPNEYHKGSQASVVFHAHPQIVQKGQLKLFKSYRPEVDHGEQKRDFIYVKDVVRVLYHLWQNKDEAKSGVYNLGTGEARRFIDLGSAVFQALGKKAQFEWIEMPENIKNQYQYFTQANLDKLRQDGKYSQTMTSLEDGVSDYVTHYLEQADPYL
ncbi:MAG: ADP-glyceromanno-heptose 6-epimerase [Oligoflexus sp.]